MIKVILIAFILSVSLSFTAYAEESTGTASTRKEKVKEKIENRVEIRKEKMASREAKLKTELIKFKDKKKAEVAERVSTNLNKINQKQTEQMQKHLGTMSLILDKLEARINKNTPAIDAARSAISSASAAVTAQTQKDYTITVTTEDKIRTDVKLKRDQLHADLSEIRKMVNNAKKSVADAISNAKRSVKEGSASGQQ